MDKLSSGPGVRYVDAYQVTITGQVLEIRLTEVSRVPSHSAGRRSASVLARLRVSVVDSVGATDLGYFVIHADE